MALKNNKTLESLLLRSNLIQDSAQRLSDDIFQISQIIKSTILNGKKLMFCGNGGSAAEAQHMAAEYCATLDHSRPRKGMAAIALTTDTSFITAWTNDFGFKEVFKRQVETLGSPGDTLVAYSTSGNSENVLHAASAAKKMSINVVLFTGNHAKTKIEKHTDFVFRAPSLSTPIIQEFHTIAGHEICSIVEEHLL